MSSAFAALRMSYVEKGVKTGTPIVLLSGFPDNELSGWGEKLPSSLEADGHRLVLMCLPGFESTSRIGSSKQTMKRDWGYSLEEVLLIMHSTIQDLGMIQLGGGVADHAFHHIGSRCDTSTT